MGIRSGGSTYCAHVVSHPQSILTLVPHCFTGLHDQTTNFTSAGIILGANRFSIGSRLGSPHGDVRRTGALMPTVQLTLRKIYNRTGDYASLRESFQKAKDGWEDECRSQKEAMKMILKVRASSVPQFRPKLSLGS
jgi:hypothetical protein